MRFPKSIRAAAILLSISLLTGSVAQAHAQATFSVDSIKGTSQSGVLLGYVHWDWVAGWVGAAAGVGALALAVAQAVDSSSSSSSSSSSGSVHFTPPSAAESAAMSQRYIAAANKTFDE